MASYHALGIFYDAVMGDRIDSAKEVRRLLRKHHPRAKSLLDIACGTGSVMAYLSKFYTLSGLDISDVMLASAQQKLPQVPLYEADMRTFELGEYFDGVICTYDSINHLLTFADWRRCFRRVRSHLRGGGVFVFDINTKHRLESFADDGAWVHEFGDHTLVIQVDRERGGRFAWDIRIFESQGSDYFRLHQECIYEVSFPVEQVREALRKEFKRVSVVDPDRRRPSAKSDRVYFVCEA